VKAARLESWGKRPCEKKKNKSNSLPDDSSLKLDGWKIKLKVRIILEYHLVRS